MLIYIHGFNSSALSFKAGLFANRMAELGRSSEFVCPELPDRPHRAVALLEDCMKGRAPAEVALIGSSLGGFYATWLAERYGARAVLVNPAVRPYELLTQALGRQKNLYTHREYEFTETHLAELRALEVADVSPSRYLLITRTGDEVLDYRQAVEKYRGCEQLVIEGGDHGFGDFALYLDRALAFCGVVAP
jgi:predicted esterase YcpF (UPF0227 family)